MSNKVYINTFIIPVMAFNLIKWSLISVINGLVKIKLPERYNNNNIFIKSYELNSNKNKETIYVKNEN